ncbi:MAG: hypothetical protein JW915_01785 [Chitinispirillaceae bacterium]|nr:hypothetical protein [Chitinispirillaceae bacterium]
MKPGIPITISISLPMSAKVDILKFEDVLFNLNSAVLLPIGPAEGEVWVIIIQLQPANRNTWVELAL